MSETVLVAVARTPFVPFGGALRSVPAPELEAVAIRDGLDRVPQAQTAGD